MKPGLVAPLTIAALVVITGCSQPVVNENRNAISTATPTPVATATPDEIAIARVNYAKHCEACHGPEGNGGPAEVEGKKIKVPSLKAGHALKHTDEDFVEQITEGEEEMPAFKDKLSPDEINMLVRFIRVEFQGK